MWHFLRYEILLVYYFRFSKIITLLQSVSAKTAIKYHELAREFVDANN